MKITIIMLFQVGYESRFVGDYKETGTKYLGKYTFMQTISSFQTKTHRHTHE